MEARTSDDVDDSHGDDDVSQNDDYPGRHLQLPFVQATVLGLSQGACQAIDVLDRTTQVMKNTGVVDENDRNFMSGVNRGDEGSLSSCRQRADGSASLNQSSQPFPIEVFSAIQ